MEIGFGTRKLRDLCERAEVMERWLGSELACALRSTLADIHAARSIFDVPTLSLDVAKLRGKPCITLRPTEALEIVVSKQASDLRIGLEWGLVHRIRIEEVRVNEAIGALRT